MNRTGVLFVCMGNICRSPAAEGVFARLLAERRLDRYYKVDSAGTIDHHEGEPPDERMRHAARRRGIDLDALRARGVRDSDPRHFQHILVMDAANLRDLKRRFPNLESSRLRMIGDYHPDKPGCEVPDPYYGGAKGFEQVLDLLEVSCARLLDELEEHRAADSAHAS